MREEPPHPLLREKNAHQAQKYLNDNPNENLEHIRDVDGNTLLHLACIWARPNLLMLYLKQQRDVLMLKHGKDEGLTRRTLQAWVNESNKEGFTPLHYASYEDDLEMVRVLEDLQANVLATTKTGLNVLHMAAQADALDSIIHFREALDINSTDHKGMTPLHWAAYLSSESAASLLLSLGCHLNPFTSERETPLHFAAQYGNTRILRKLLMHGADRHLRNSKGETPLMISRANEFKNISKMLDDDFGFLDHVRFYFNVQIRYSPQSRSLTMPALFIFSTLLVAGSAHAMLRIDLEGIPDEKYLLAGAAAVYLSFYGIYLSLLTAPKGLAKGTRFEDLLGKEEVCTECICEKEPRSYHCEICKTCIRRYDHHCPWINGCVGQRNLKRFILFLVLLLLIIAECGVLSGLGLFSKWIAWRFDTNDTLMLIMKIVLGVDLALCAIFFFPLMSLVWVQCTNICINKTTFERYSKPSSKKTHKASPPLTDSDLTEPMNRNDSRSSSVLSREE